MINFIQVLVAALASVGFAIIFHIRFKHFIAIAIGGGLSWLSYELVYSVTANDAFAMFIASLTISIFSEIMARINKAPTSIFYIPSMIPLIPGGNLYYCFSYYLQQQISESSNYGSILLRQSLAIVLGAVVVYTVTSLFNKKGYYHDIHH